MAISNLPKDMVEVECYCHAETDLAVLLDHGGDEPVWVPKSQMEDWPDVGEYGEVLVKEWIAKEKGMI